VQEGEELERSSEHGVCVCVGVGGSGREGVGGRGEGSRLV
jgi:hypothetical protein